jgi:mannose-6-phosphate isomerase-like protein (cupin superfamily)
MTDAHDPRATFVHLGTGPETALIDVTPDFWETIGARTELHTGRLVTAMDMAEDWGVWEMHPAGDELIVVVDGEVRFHLDDGATTSEVEVVAPEFIVVPTGTWHTADALGPARLLIVTWGEGTTHRPR